MRLPRRLLPAAAFALFATLLSSAQSAPDRLAALKTEAAADGESRKVFTQRMVDTISSSPRRCSGRSVCPTPAS